MTPFRKHIETYQGCTKCDLHRNRQRMVYARGDIPCDVLFIGEAPGESEDSLGQPFMGPAGQEQDKITEKAFRGYPFTYCYGNLVCCIPLGDDGKKVKEPDDECIEACAPRLRDFVRITNPKLIVCLGKLANDWLDMKYKHAIRFHKPIARIHVTHPAAIVRANPIQMELMRQRAVVAISNALEELQDSLKKEAENAYLET